MAHGYMPRTYPGRLTLFWAGSYPDYIRDDAGDLTAQWLKVAREAEVYLIPGTHTTCLTADVYAVSDLLRWCLSRA
jgi:hypothetical protein